MIIKNSFYNSIISNNKSIIYKNNYSGSQLIKIHLVLNDLINQKSVGNTLPNIHINTHFLFLVKIYINMKEKKRFKGHALSV
jgi:hypothetical protein